MAKKQLKFKPTPAGILFLSAIGVLLIAIIVLIVYGATHCGSCKKQDDNGDKNTPSISGDADPDSSALPTESTPVETPDPNAPTDPNATVDPNATIDPNATVDPNATIDPNATPGAIGTPDNTIVVNTPGQSTGTTAPAASASPTGITIYTSPSSAQKKNAQKGYVNADSVNMRKGPGKSYDVVKSKIEKNTAVTLYEEQNGWWFLKCGDKYGYIKKDYISKGSAPSTPSNSSSSSEVSGKVIASKVALRKEATEKSDCVKEYSKGEAVTIYHYVKDSSGRKWYYVKTSDGKKGYMFAEYVKADGKVSAG